MTALDRLIIYKTKFIMLCSRKVDGFSVRIFEPTNKIKPIIEALYSLKQT